MLRQWGGVARLKRTRAGKLKDASGSRAANETQLREHLALHRSGFRLVTFTR
jgi:hypothetical protein